MRSRRPTLQFEMLESRSLLASQAPIADLSENVATFAPAYVSLLAEGEGDDRYLGGAHDPYLPNFGHSANTGGRIIVESTSDGDWRTALPLANANDIVLVKHHVSLVGEVVAHTIVVQPGASLRFSRTQNTSLRVVTLQVLAGGTLDLGTVKSPIKDVRAEIVFRDVPIDLAVDPAQFGNGLLVFGNVTMHGRELSQTFAESTSEILRGQSELQVKGGVADWGAGDKLLIPDTRQLTYDQSVSSLDAYETFDLANATTGSLILARSTARDHLGARNTNRELVFSPYVANLTRTVVLRSENPNGVKGHVMVLDQAMVDIRFVELKDLGRTTNSDLDSTRFDAQGKPVHIGKNQVGRYPIHVHHLSGPEVPPANGQQFTIFGNSIYSTTKIAKWGIAIHDSHYGLISHNVLYNLNGAGISTEGGSESYNTISNNFISRIGGTGERGKFTDGREGAGIWLRRPNSYVNNNVVTGAVKAAYFIFGGDNTPPPPVRIPAFPGAHHNNEYIYVPAETMTLQSFDGNIAYASYTGVEFWYMGFRNYYDPTELPIAQTTVADLGFWNISSKAIFIEQAYAFRFDNTRIYGDPSQFNDYNYPIGIDALTAVDVKFKNLIVENYRTGIAAPLRVAKLDPMLSVSDIEPFTIDGGRLANETNIVIDTPSQDAFANFAPRSVLIKNVDFAPDSRGVSVSNIDMRYAPGRFTNLVQKDLVQVVNYDNTGKDYRVYYYQQVPDFIVPQTGSMSDEGPGSPLGAPVAGLTNRQTWERYGIAIAGEVAPGNSSHPAAIKVSGIRGLVFAGTVSNIVLKALVPDTGNSRDFITSAQRIELSGEGRPRSSVALTWEGQRIGVAVVDDAGRWAFDFRHQLLADGKHLFGVQELNSQGMEVGPISSRLVTIRPHVAQLQAAVVDIFNDAVSGDLAAKITIFDEDLGDSHVLAIQQPSQFVINAAGEIRLADSAKLAAGASYPLVVRATDSAGLVATKNVTILATRRPAGDWVTRLHYTEFGQLTAEDVQFLTNVQLASIPDYYWFSRMSGPARAALSATQVQRLTNLQSINTVLLLTQEQRAALTVTQVQALKFQDFAFLPALQISRLSSSQIASIPDPYWLGQIPASSRSALTGGQIVNLLNLKEQGMIALLTLGQRQSLTPGQLQTLTYLDFEYVPASQIVFLSRGQIASIPDDYWFARIGTTARAALTNVQVTSLFVRPQGMLSLLTSTQRNWLTPVQIQALTYLDFEYLPSTQIQHLSGMQIASIPDYYWFARIGTTARAALTNVQVASLIVRPQGMLALLTPTQRNWLTPVQIQTLTYLDFEYLPSTQIQYLSGVQIASIPDTYWMARISSVSRLGFTQSQVQRINLRPTEMIAFLTQVQRSWLTDLQLKQLSYTDFRFLPTSLVLRLTDSQLLSIRDRYWFFQFSEEARASLLKNGVSWVDGIGVVIRR